MWGKGDSDGRAGEGNEMNGDGQYQERLEREGFFVE